MHQSFDRLAFMYDYLAQLVFGDAIYQSQVSLLDQLAPGQSILVVGGGTGWILPDLIHKSKPDKITFLEASPRMLKRAQNRFENLNSARIKFIQGTEAELRAEEKFDAIFTPYVFDLYPYPYLANMFSQLDAHLMPGGQWLCTDFQGSGGKRNTWDQLFYQGMYRFFTIWGKLQPNTLPDVFKVFGEHSYELRTEKTFFARRIAARLYQKPF